MSFLVPVFQAGPAAGCDVERGLPVVHRPHAELSIHRSWPAFAESVGMARVAIVCDPGSMELGPRLAVLHAATRAGLVIIAKQPAPGLPEARGVEVVASADLDSVLPDAFGRALTYGVLRNQAGRIDRTPGLSPIFRGILEIGLLSHPPFRTVAAFAGAVGRSPGELWRLFRAETRAARPKEFLRWVMLVNSVLRWHERTSWERIASELGVSTHTLRRASIDLTGSTPGRLTARSGEGLIEKFLAYLRTAFGV